MGLDAVALALGIEVSARSRAIRPGELVVLTMVPPAGSQRVQVRAFDRDVPAFRIADREWEALVGIDLDVRPGTYTVSVTAGSARAGYELVVTPRAFRTRRLTVDEAFVTPPKSEQARIEREAALLTDTWKTPQ
jgi:hypothetical protein